MYHAIGKCTSHPQGLCSNAIGWCPQLAPYPHLSKIYQADALGNMVYNRISAPHGHMPTVTYPFVVKWLLWSVGVLHRIPCW